jgi:hypothetical protein
MRDQKSGLGCTNHCLLSKGVEVIYDNVPNMNAGVPLVNVWTFVIRNTERFLQR